MAENVSAISSNELLLLIASISVLGIIGAYIGEKLSTIARTAIFIILCTHLNLNSLIKYGGKAFLIALILIFIDRPIVVIICTTFDRKVIYDVGEGSWSNTCCLIRYCCFRQNTWL